MKRKRERSQKPLQRPGHWSRDRPGLCNDWPTRQTFARDWPTLPTESCCNWWLLVRQLCDWSVGRQELCDWSVGRQEPCDWPLSERRSRRSRVRFQPRVAPEARLSGRVHHGDGRTRLAASWRSSENEKTDVVSSNGRRSCISKFCCIETSMKVFTQWKVSQVVTAAPHC